MADEKQTDVVIVECVGCGKKIRRVRRYLTGQSKCKRCRCSGSIWHGPLVSARGTQLVRAREIAKRAGCAIEHVYAEWRAGKVHCATHGFTADITQVDGKPICRVCRNRRSKESYHRNKETDR